MAQPFCYQICSKDKSEGPRRLQGPKGLWRKCSYFGICTALEAHQRLKVDQACAEISWQDLENKVMALTDVDQRVGRMSRCLTVLKRTGVRYKDSEDIIKIKDYERINTGIKADVGRAVKNYLKVGPMVGTFEVHGTNFDKYGEGEFLDEIYIAEKQMGTAWTHVVAVTGFGVQGLYPFWEFQNAYGPSWRGAAQGFGQIYAVHLHWLYGFTLA